MNSMLKMSVVIGLLLALLVSCGSNPTKTIDDRTRTVSPFPQEVGMYWSYEVYDNLTEETDTVEVAVIDSGTSGSSTATLWKELRDGGVVTTLWESIDDTLVISERSPGDSLLKRFVFPLDLGATWTGPMTHDSSEVMLAGVVLVLPIGRLHDVSRIDRRWSTDFEGGGSFSRTWIAEGVGMALLSIQNQYSDGTTVFTTLNEYWQLLDYDLNTFGIHEYPTTVGTHWTYNVLDTNMNIIDTLNVMIVGDTVTSEGLPATLWTYDYGSRVDSELVGVGASSVRHQSPITFPDTYYEFPLAIGKYWGMHFFAPVAEIVEKGPVSVPAGDFVAGFEHWYGGGAFNYYWSADSWLVPNVGLVKRRLATGNLAPLVTVHWELTDYYIAP